MPEEEPSVPPSRPAVSVLPVVVRRVGADPAVDGGTTEASVPVEPVGVESGGGVGGVSVVGVCAFTVRAGHAPK